MKVHQVEPVDFRGNTLLLRVDGQSLELPLESISERLVHAEPWQRQVVEISPSGYGLHGPVPDEDLSIGGLVRTHHQVHVVTR